MSSDDFHFLDILSSVPNNVRRHGGDIVEFIESLIDFVAEESRETIQSSSWLPESMKPPAPLPPPPTDFSIAPANVLEQVTDWISRNRAEAAAIATFLGTGAFLIWRNRRSHNKRRRAKRSALGGAKTEVVVLAGSPQSPLTRSLSLDLESRGFIVYIPVSSFSEEQYVKSQSRADILPLTLDITSDSSRQQAVQKFTTYITSLYHFHPRHPPSRKHLTAFIVVPSPSSSYATASLTSLAPSTWSDALNSQLLAPFVTTQAFLSLIKAQKSRIVVLTSSIIPSLTPPFHAVESVVTGGIEKWIHTLRAEMQVKGVDVVQVKMGSFDYRTVPGTNQQLVYYPKGNDSDIQVSDEKGSSLRELHHGVFDAISGRARGTIFVGKGSSTYSFVGRWVPKGLVGWMMGVRKGIVEGEKDERLLSSEGSAEWEKVEQSD